MSSPGRIFAPFAVSFVVAGAALGPSAAAEVWIGHTSGQSCTSIGEEHGHQTTCAGPAPYVAIIRDRNSVMTISLGRSAAHVSHLDHGSLDLVWRGMSPFVGRSVEWRLRNSKPFAAIIRIFTIAPDGSPREQILVAKVTPAGGCEIARINASDSAAYQTARDLADSQAGSVVCAGE